MSRMGGQASGILQSPCSRRVGASSWRHKGVGRSHRGLCLVVAIMYETPPVELPTGSVMPTWIGWWRTLWSDPRGYASCTQTHNGICCAMAADVMSRQACGLESLSTVHVNMCVLMFARALHPSRFFCQPVPAPTFMQGGSYSV